MDEQGSHGGDTAPKNAQVSFPSNNLSIMACGSRVDTSPTTRVSSHTCSSNSVAVSGTGLWETETTLPLTGICEQPFRVTHRHTLKREDTKRPTLPCAQLPPMTRFARCQNCQCRCALWPHGRKARVSMVLCDQDCAFSDQALQPVEIAQIVAIVIGSNMKQKTKGTASRNFKSDVPPD